jgi:hypothetical protein
MFLSKSIFYVGFQPYPVENNLEKFDSYVQLYVMPTVLLYNNNFTIINIVSLGLVWCPGQNKRIAPLSFFHGCRKLSINQETRVNPTSK